MVTLKPERDSVVSRLPTLNLLNKRLRESGDNYLDTRRTAPTTTSAANGCAGRHHSRLLHATQGCSISREALQINYRKIAGTAGALVAEPHKTTSLKSAN